MRTSRTPLRAPLLAALVLVACVDSSVLTAPPQPAGAVNDSAGGDASLAVTTWPRAPLADFDITLEAAPVTREPVESVEWEFADGGTARGFKVHHTFASEGRTSLLVRARTTGGAIVQRRVILTVTPSISALGTVLSGIVPGGLHTCAIDAGASLYCWGYNGNGTVGDGTRTYRYSPTLVGAGMNFAQVATGVGHSCALTQAGAAYCWGKNESGQLGDGTTIDRTVPTAVLGGLTFSSIDVGNTHSCALTTAGAAYCWGADSLGQLGDNAPAVRQLQPVAVAGGLTFSVIRAGYTHSCALQQTSGRAYCWGSNNTGQIGNGAGGSTASDRVTVPTAVSGGTSFAQIDIGASHTCAVVSNTKDKMQVWCWGWNGSGQLGVSTAEMCRGNVPCARLPQRLPYNATVVAITAGSSHSCGIISTGDLYCWGSNSNGQLGDGTTTNRAVPTQVPNVQFKTVRAGRNFTCGVLLDNTARCWGSNYYGMLGQGDNVDRPTPAAVPNLTF